MTKLTFPTMAERAVQEFRRPGRTTSVAKIAARMGADVERTFDGEIVYIFDDDTSVVTKGRGRAHRLETLLP